MSRAEYRAGSLLAFFLAGLSISLLLLFGPDDPGSRVPTKVDGHFTWRGWLVLGAGAYMLIRSLPDTVNVMMGRPPIEIQEGELAIWMFPRQRIPVRTISAIAIDNHSVEIRLDDGEERRMNTLVIDEPRFFFFNAVRPMLRDPSMLFEKDEA